MAGRKPIVDDRKSKPLITYVSEEDLNILNAYLRETKTSESRAWFIRDVVFQFIKGNIVPKENVLSFDGISGEDRAILQSVLKDKEKTSYLMNIIKDSKYLGGK